MNLPINGDECVNYRNKKEMVSAHTGCLSQVHASTVFQETNTTE